jgi:hypothetical protein
MTGKRFRRKTTAIPAKLIGPDNSRLDFDGSIWYPLSSIVGLPALRTYFIASLT